MEVLGTKGAAKLVNRATNRARFCLSPIVILQLKTVPSVHSNDAGRVDTGILICDTNACNCEFWNSSVGDYSTARRRGWHAPMHRADVFQGPKIRCIGQCYRGDLPMFPTQCLRVCKKWKLVAFSHMTVQHCRHLSFGKRQTYQVVFSGFSYRNAHSHYL